MIFQFKLSRSNSFNSLSLPALLANPNYHGNIGFHCKFRFIFKALYLEQSGKTIASPQTSFGVRLPRIHFSPKFLAHSIKSLTDRANLKKRLGLRFTKIRKRPVIGERKCRLCLADVRGGGMNA